MEWRTEIQIKLKAGTTSRAIYPVEAFMAGGRGRSEQTQGKTNQKAAHKITRHQLEDEGVPQLQGENKIGSTYSEENKQGEQFSWVTRRDRTVHE